MRYLLLLLFSLALYIPAEAQFKTATPSHKKIDASQIKLNTIQKAIPAEMDAEGFDYFTAPSLTAPAASERKNGATIQINRTKNEYGVPQLIEVFGNANQSEVKAADFVSLMQGSKEALQQGESSSFVIVSQRQDKSNHTHFKADQYISGVRVYDGQVTAHFYQDGKQLIMGRVIPEHVFEGIDPIAQISEADAIAFTKASFSSYQKIEWFESSFSQFSTELVFYDHGGHYHLAWHVDAYENLAERHNYFIDATTGAVLNTYGTICKIHGHDHGHDCNAHTNIAPPDGPTTATAEDLLGVNRTINTYEAGNNFFMLDASRPMFNASASSMPDDPVGGILTLDANNTAPQNSNFQVEHVVSSNNNWNGRRTAVSAHHNAGESYEYFRTTHSRNSINGDGGSLYSLINVADENGNSMGNAFWNGIAMFYGNGDSAFEPLARALDVAGHEISHGVVQNTANLEYQGESGAMNESFADIFGAMIDRDDWLIGEDVAKSSVFPGGALRNMQDPHNNAPTGDYGRGWQPKHVNEKFTGSQDNGGVHINSGIPNHAFYLFATAIGKEKAEDVFYQALDLYLVKSSQFVDLRNAVVQAAEDLYGQAEIDAAKSAFEQVGIGEGPGGNYQEDANINPGEDLITFYNPASDEMVLLTASGNNTLFGNPIISGGLLSRVSVTDDGREMVLIGQDRLMYYIFLNWDTGEISLSVLSEDPIWRNVIISKDGQRIAALFDDETNRIWVYDFNSENQRTYELYNPTFSEGVSTGDVLYADAMEFDITGQYVVYDAINEIPSSSGVNIEYWDIGFLHCWDRSSNTFTSNSNQNYISKLFSALPEGVSAGNPTFSKNSPFILAFDFLEGNSYQLRAGNLETGDLGLVFENTDLSWPNYSRGDNQMIYNLSTLFGDDIGITNLSGDKINGQANSDDFFILNAQLGVWFSNGERNLYVDTEETIDKELVSIFPNPATDQLSIVVEDHDYQNYEIFNISGQRVLAGDLDGDAIQISGLQSGKYVLRLNGAKHWIFKSFIKQ